MLISYPDLKVPLLLNHDEKFLSRKTPHLQESRRSHSSAETYHSLFLSRKNIEAKPLLTLKGRDSPQTYRLHTAFHASFAARLLPCGGKNVSPTRFSSPFESLHIPKERRTHSCPSFFWRRGRDSNPRVVSHKLISRI